MATIPSCESAHGTRVKIAKSDSCVGHKPPRPVDPVGNLSIAAKGQPIKASDVELLRGRIRNELELRMKHSSYSSAALNTHKNQINNPHVAGNKVSAQDRNNEEAALFSIFIQAETVHQGGIVVNNEPTTSKNQYKLKENESPKMVKNVNQSYSNPYNATVAFDTDSVREQPDYRRNDILGSGRSNSLDLVFPWQYITAASYEKLKENYAKLSADCICHSDCACNAVCACHNNCGCNY